MLLNTFSVISWTMGIITQTKKKKLSMSAKVVLRLSCKRMTPSRKRETLLSLNLTSNQLENPWLCSKEGHKFVQFYAFLPRFSSHSGL